MIVSYLAGKGKEPLCKDELFVAISASIKLPRCASGPSGSIRAYGKVHRASENRSHEERVKDIDASLEKSKLTESGELQCGSLVNFLRKIRENINRRG